MAPKKRKSRKTLLNVEEKPEITIDLPEEPQLQPDKIAEDIETLEKKDPVKDRNSQADTIEQNITRMKTRDGVLGYILKNTKSASIDLKDPTKIIEYATLSSSTFETSEKLSDIFELGSIKQVIIEGGTAKLLSFADGENKVSVFMEKKIDHKRIYKDLLD